ncbi:IS66 family insertion sequence element accessory protein TnpA [Motilimonas cestriensis]|uniref:IS66 family insertion sequence element accessory protein TnpA n=1 Tax=Motilimonas cestriensis TaxID=2742685 RepID=UPI003DA42233
MRKRRTNQEWQNLIAQSESSSLSTLAFCKLNELNPSTFYAKRQKLNKTDVPLGFVREEVVAKYQAQSARRDELYEWMTTQQVMESSPLGKAIKYTLGQWPKLIRYIDDGHLSIDNNRAERAIKPLGIGRKNWLFSANPNGAEASAMLYSIVETAKANGLILYDYMVKCMQELAKAEPDIDAPLPRPWNFKH